MSRLTLRLLIPLLLPAISPHVAAQVQVLAHDYATSGDGSASDPWVGWEDAIASGREVVFQKYHYEAPSTTIILPSDVVLTGVDGATVQWAESRGAENMCHIAPGTSNVVIRGLRFAPDVTVPAEGISGGGGSYVKIGTNGSSGVVDHVQIVDNRFGVMRYSTAQLGVSTIVMSSVNDVVITDNFFDAAPGNIGFLPGNNSVLYTYRNVRCERNHISYS